MLSFEGWALSGKGDDGMSQGLKPRFVACGERPKAEALGYLEAKTQGEAKAHGRSLRRWVQAGLVCLMAVVMLGADPSARVNKVGDWMVFTIGFGQGLAGVN